jgi:hypothetical protein
MSRCANFEIVQQTPKLCECGCGRETGAYGHSRRRLGQIKGQPKRFLPGHCRRKNGENNPNWRGGRVISCGYVRVFSPEHPRADKRGYVGEHVLAVEKAIGHFLSLPHIPHHVDRNKRNNVNSNLVACEDLQYHSLLHERQKALDACGDVHKRKCQLCRTWDHVENLNRYGTVYGHKACLKKRDRERKDRRLLMRAGSMQAGPDFGPGGMRGDFLKWVQGVQKEERDSLKGESHA